MTTEIDFEKYKPIIITFDGTSASGKGTIVKGLREKLGEKYRVLDAGLMYRVITYYFQKINQINPDSLREYSDLKKFLKKEVNVEMNELGEIVLNGTIIEDSKLRGPEIDPFIARYAEIDEVKLNSIAKQKQIIQSYDGGWILDGRCMGSAVAPDAQAKFYMDAPLLVRATRRHIDYIRSGKTGYSTEEIAIDLQKRDRKDMNTNIAPLVKPNDAIEIDSYKRNPEQAIEIAIDYVTKKIIEEGKK